MNARIVLSVAVLLLAGCASSAERQAEQEKMNTLAETHVLLGSSYLQRGQLDVAKAELDKALKLLPDHSQANNIMAVLQWRFKDYDKADRLFRKALASDEKNANAHRLPSYFRIPTFTSYSTSHHLASSPPLFYTQTPRSPPAPTHYTPVKNNRSLTTNPI